MAGVLGIQRKYKTKKRKQPEAMPHSATLKRMLGVETRMYTFPTFNGTLNNERVNRRVIAERIIGLFVLLAVDSRQIKETEEDVGGKVRLIHYPEVYETAIRYIDAFVQKTNASYTALVATATSDAYSIVALIMAMKLLWEGWEYFPGKYLDDISKAYLHTRFTAEQLVDMEFELHRCTMEAPPTVYGFLYYHLQYEASTAIRRNAQKIADMALMDSDVAGFPPSATAVSCVALAHRAFWNTMVKATCCNDNEVAVHASLAAAMGISQNVMSRLWKRAIQIPFPSKTEQDAPAWKQTSLPFAPATEQDAEKGDKPQNK